MTPERPVPYRCEACVAEGSYTGILVWPGYEPPVCRTHPKERLTPVRWTDLVPQPPGGHR